VRDFKTATHARMQPRGANAPHLGCEGCHGAGSLHNQSGGAIGTIINPKKSPEICFRCHLDKQAEFNLPYSHPVLAGQMSCSDCHDPHVGSILRGGPNTILAENEQCFKCHIVQRGPFVFEHEATREGVSTATGRTARSITRC
jgi:formate-dependent nitrite reductase cytochrome c552 subunit